MMATVSFEVEGYPPAKSEAKSMLGVGHRHADRVVRLLEAAREATSRTFGSEPVGLEVAVVSPDDGNRSDATNWLGGIGDILQGKGQPRGLDLTHLADLVDVVLFDDDRQIEQLKYSWAEGGPTSYTIRVWALSSEEGSTAPNEGERFLRPDLERAGFTSFLSFDELRDTNLDGVPGVPGVYVVVRENERRPRFLDVSIGGHFKGEDPTVESDVLDANWVAGAQTVYIGKASVLRRRLRQFVQFGAGRPVGHRGGRLIWQLEGSGSLRVGWKPTLDQDPEIVERRLLNGFRACYGGRLPFANLR
jgi:hypothetical protein